MRPNAEPDEGDSDRSAGRLAFWFRYGCHLRRHRCAGEALRAEPQRQGLTVAIGLVGTVVGALGAGVVGQRLGARETLRMTAVLYVVSAVGMRLAWNWPSLMIFRFIGGLGIGASSVLGPVYIAELAPAKWRGRLVGAFQFNVVFGILLAIRRTIVIRYAAPGRGGVALAGGRCGGAGAWIPDAAVRDSAQPALVGLTESHR